VIGEEKQRENKKSKTPRKPTAPKEAKDLLSYLHHLRFTGRQLCRTISTNIERDVIETVEIVNSAIQKGGSQKKKTTDLTKATSILERLTVKPEKGRRGDLKKIEKAMRAVKEALSSGKNG